MKACTLLPAVSLIAASLFNAQQAHAETWAYAGLDEFSPPDGIYRSQGAKVRGDFLYAAVDDDRKSIYRISLIDGTMTELFQLSQWHDLEDGHPHKLEGLSFLNTVDGETLNVLMIHGDRRDLNDAYTMFFHFRPVAP